MKQIKIMHNIILIQALKLFKVTPSALVTSSNENESI